MLYAYQVIHFNPRPREEGDNVIVILLTDSKISIHALVKRATAERFESGEYTKISIHALVKRATKAIIHRFATAGISIHALVKRATAVRVVCFQLASISIHALVKRATVQLANPLVT